ncbi:hypothetical protein CORC01_08716 [Colletotrichum orchidophilum]|uniref:Uncharacterized protein n=1 Tax=Colletotrichum orchidophilum TaxID=1209926 RepID=A0A1G4B3X1_9PEZI|nr:uncharacterized protein CORC01_08716 [Colletotrichum orchidophilum]OHE96023.1 hypothetical protein CORC01_08716 [Colletotrichum orchidophilum]
MDVQPVQEDAVAIRRRSVRVSPRQTLSRVTRRPSLPSIGFLGQICQRRRFHI